MMRLLSANSRDREFIPAEGHLKTLEMGQYQKRPNRKGFARQSKKPAKNKSI